MRGKTVCLLLFLLFPSLAVADFSGSVVSVLDGGTIEVLHNHHTERIRLNGIDCPEKGQAYGKRAKQAASELVHGKEVTLQTHGKDKYGPSTTRPSGCWGRGPFPSSALSTRGRSGPGK
jgi:micrococcal nuclease